MLTCKFAVACRYLSARLDLHLCGRTLCQMFEWGVASRNPQPVADVCRACGCLGEAVMGSKGTSPKGSSRLKGPKDPSRSRV